MLTPAKALPSLCHRLWGLSWGNTVAAKVLTQDRAWSCTEAIKLIPPCRSLQGIEQTAEKHENCGNLKAGFSLTFPKGLKVIHIHKRFETHNKIHDK